MTGFPTQTVGPPMNRGKARRYKGWRRAQRCCAPTWERIDEEPRILHLQCSGNILCFRSEAGRTERWAQAHFFVGPVGVHCKPAKVEESLRGFGKNPRRCRAGGAFGRPGNR